MPPQRFAFVFFLRVFIFLSALPFFAFFCSLWMPAPSLSDRTRLSQPNAGLRRFSLGSVAPATAHPSHRQRVDALHPPLDAPPRLPSLTPSRRRSAAHCCARSSPRTTPAVRRSTSALRSYRSPLSHLPASTSFSRTLLSRPPIRSRGSRSASLADLLAPFCRDVRRLCALLRRRPSTSYVRPRSNPAGSADRFGRAEASLDAPGVAPRQRTVRRSRPPHGLLTRLHSSSPRTTLQLDLAPSPLHFRVRSVPSRSSNDSAESLSRPPPPSLP